MPHFSGIRSYDRLGQRRWLFVPLWGIPSYFYYAPRRVKCAEHGVVIEHIPWSDGKRPVTCAMMGVLARWARRLSWRETAQAFQTSWEAVYRSVEWFVQWGLAHRELRAVESIGVDEIHWGRGLRADNFLTVIYQIDADCRRLHGLVTGGLFPPLSPVPRERSSCVEPVVPDVGRQYQMRWPAPA